jgi:serine/threonine protein kinase
LKDRKKFTEKEAAQIVLQTSEAVRYLHSFKIIHRDIKP